jgi:hypothetical protein
MKPNRLSNVLAAVAAVIGGVVFVTELAYWLSHLRRPGPAPHIALAGLAIALLAGSLLARRDR